MDPITCSERGFSTSFSLPYGTFFSVQGKIVSRRQEDTLGWTLLWHQSILPSYDSWVFESLSDRKNSLSGAPISAFVTTRFAFLKGSSLVFRVRPEKVSSRRILYCPLFCLDYGGSGDAGSNHYMLVTFKVLQQRVVGNLPSIYLKSNDGKILAKIQLLSQSQPVVKDFENGWVEVCLDFRLEAGQVVSEIGIENVTDPNVASIEEKASWSDVLAIGALHLTDSLDVDEMPLYTIHSVEFHGESREISWQCELPLYNYSFFNIYRDEEWIGSSYNRNCRFKVDSSAAGGKKYSVQPVLAKFYRTLKLDECPFATTTTTTIQE